MKVSTQKSKSKIQTQNAHIGLGNQKGITKNRDNKVLFGRKKNAIAEVMIVICMEMLGNVREMHDVQALIEKIPGNDASSNIKVFHC